MIWTTKVSSPIGDLFIYQKEDHLIALQFDPDFSVQFLQGEHVNKLPSHDPLFTPIKRWLDAYFSQDFTHLPTIRTAYLQATKFRCQVWDQVAYVGPGQVVSYGQLGQEISNKFSKRVSAQAVGNALANNPLLLVTPCHRVVASDGSLRGYRGGVDRKAWLLTHEMTITKERKK